MSKYLNVDRRKTLFKAFLHLQCVYCLIVWMFHDKNVEYNRLHERVLRLVYRIDNSTFKELLIKNGSVTIHHSNIQLLEIELFKHKMGFLPTYNELIILK